MFDDYLRSILLYFISKLYVQKVKDSNNEAIEHQIPRIHYFIPFSIRPLHSQILVIQCQQLLVLFGTRLYRKFKIAVIKNT